jgi:hypothetical protein
MALSQLTVINKGDAVNIAIRMEYHTLTAALSEMVKDLVVSHLIALECLQSDAWEQ